MFVRLSAVRRGAVASITLVALTVSVAGCGSDSDGGKGPESGDKASATGQDKASKTPAADDESGQGAGGSKQLSPAELTERIVAKADMVGSLKGYSVMKPGPGDIDLSGGMRASGTECQPLIDVLNDVAPSGADETERRAVTGSKADRLEEGLGSQVALSSYAEEAKAKAAMDELEAAAGTCSDGFEATGEKKEDQQSFTSVDTKPAPKGTDQAIGYAMVGDIADGEEVAEGQSSEMPMLFAFARSGSTIAMFLTYNPFNPKKTAFPEGLIDTQIKKLTAAGE
ncbi:hypothetical protein G5C51_24590 [Streptomyces sp. A7024]|uniref:Lipoprotein n=1 Tax=Streptomyces coryli TaxID=1128680 RepID=A0A6G4U4Q3_9ACTN|nr:hypothetical protein [Streptomyces coryli]NGN67073.1 hypothetical protein [Streptomyces coryli]